MKILEIAKYEFLLLRRTTRFKLVILLYVIIIGIVNFGIANFNKNGESPLITSLSSFPPYVSCYLFSFISALTIPFIIGSFLIDDKKIRVHEVMYSKPVSNLTYILGKYTGSIFTIITICLTVLFISLIIQISIAVRPFKIYPYITSLFLICLPTVIFLTGLVFALNSIIKNRLIVLLVVIGFSICSIFIIGERWFRLLDFSAITLPLNQSDIMGYGNITNEIFQRIAYFFMGLFLILFSCLFPFRPTETKLLNIKMLIISTVTFLISALLFIIIINNISGDKRIRINTLIAHDKYSEFPLIGVAHYDMDITLFPSKHRMKVNVKMNISFPEDEKITKLVFVLNSGLKVNNITDENGLNLPYNREYSILAVDIENSDNLPKQIYISYEGTINENSFYLIEEKKEKIYLEFGGIRFPQFRWNVGDCSSWIGKGSIFLIPESRWYPVPGADYKGNVRILKPTNFTTAEISVTIPEKYKVATQGSLINTKKEKNKIIYTYKTDIPVPQFSLNAGEYIVKHTEVDSIHFYAYYSPIHRRYAEFFADTSNIIQETIKELKDWIETETTLKYPYPSFSMIEVPLDFRTYYETYEDFNPMVQPGIVMITENNINLANGRYIQDNNSDLKRSKRRGEEFNISDRKKFYFINYLAGNLAATSKFGRYGWGSGDFVTGFLNIVTEYWGFQIGSKDKISSLIRKSVNRQISQFPGAGGSELSIIRKKIFDAIETKPIVEFSPIKDGILYDNAMRLKCPAIMKSLSQEIGEDKYKETISGFLEKYKYKNFSFEDFKRFGEEISGRRLDKFFHQWFETSLLPGYTITKAESYPITTKKIETNYQMKVRVRNWEEGSGNVKVHFKTEKDDIYRDIPFESNEEKEIGVVAPDKPEFVEIDPIFAKNWSNPKFIYNVPEKPINAIPFEGVKTVKPEKSEEITVDDQDEGFSIISLKEDRFRYFGRKENESNIKEEFSGIRDVLFSGINNWTRISHWRSYGKYRNFMVIKNKGKGETYAAWKALIPEDGFYETYIFIHDYTRTMNFVNESIGKVFHITIVHDNEESKVELKTSRDMDGWHYIGEFEYNKGETAEIRLSDRCDGVVIADAVKWVPAD